MSALNLARWQFGITTIYHFLFVPLTIGLAVTVAVLHTAWYRTEDERWLRQTKFWGKLFLITFALGVVTGIVQEFQFGMAWASYSRFVGDVFGAPLAMEGLAAFFLESTFLGLWIFGWDLLPRRAHLTEHLARGRRHRHLRLLHTGRQLLDAAPGGRRLQRRGGSGRDDLHLEGPDQLDGARRVPPHHPGAPGHRGDVPRGHLGLVAVAQHRRAGRRR